MTTVLIVDDSMTQRQLISKILEQYGLTILVATDGVEAWDQLQHTLPDIVVLDIIMPRMNGYEVCRKIKTDPAMQKVPVVLCSSKAEEFDRYWGMKQGADAYVSKPFQPKELLSIIQKLLQG
ncbi:MAG: response regulator [Thermosynechococcaceae cyanobacterium MS004]|jgi:twitching motility two-component system response regulator PilH|nr:response regulator [Thermosynechococcaceae cyanobacterium MS004]